MNREVCIHGNELTHFAPGETSVDVRVCMECLAESGHRQYDTEREELAAKCYVGLIACSEVQGTFMEIAERAFDAADAFLRQRNEERRK